MNTLKFSFKQIAYVCPTNSDVSVVLRPHRKGYFKAVVNNSQCSKIGQLHWFGKEWALKGKRGSWMDNPDNRQQF